MGIMDAIMGDEIDRDAYVNHQTLLYAVQREMFCQDTGAILDVRRAVLSTVRLPDGTAASLIRTDEAFERVGGTEQVRAVADHFGGTYEVIDGRDFTADGKLRAAARKRITAAQA
jgi:hypothetical protein